MEQFALDWNPAPAPPLTVSELSARIRQLLAGEFVAIRVAGEISGVRIPSSGHCYFTLKDRDAQLQCVCYRQSLRLLKCKPQDGLAVIARGSIDVYEARGQYQLLVEALEPAGAGALQLAFEQLKARLAAEGLFDPARKRPLPAFPTRIGIVTSPTGAVIRDILNVLERRFPGLHIRLYPAQVQGEGSAASVCRGLEYFSRSGWPSVVILARGGGSIEDLWTFNEESVARAIAASSVPVVSAIGHETDFTIADFTADLRAPTPSAAAELVIPPRAQVLNRFAAASDTMARALRYRLAVSARRLHETGVLRAASGFRRSLGRRQQRADELDFRLRQASRARLTLSHRRLDAASARLAALDLRLRFARFRQRLAAARAASAGRIAVTLARRRSALETLTAHLSQLSPLKILDRGYAIVHNPAGAIVKAPADAPPGSSISVRLAQGRLAARVLRVPRAPAKR